MSKVPQKTMMPDTLQVVMNKDYHRATQRDRTVRRGTLKRGYKAQKIADDNENAQGSDQSHIAAASRADHIVSHAASEFHHGFHRQLKLPRIFRRKPLPQNQRSRNDDQKDEDFFSDIVGNRTGRVSGRKARLQEKRRDNTTSKLIQQACKPECVFHNVSRAILLTFRLNDLPRRVIIEPRFGTSVTAPAAQICAKGPACGSYNLPTAGL